MEMDMDMDLGKHTPTQYTTLLSYVLCLSGFCVDSKAFLSKMGIGQSGQES
jgi:hypothetical protein